MKAVLFFLLGFFASAKAQEIVITPTLNTEEKINADKISSFHFWDTFEFQLLETDTSFEVFSGNEVLFAGTLCDGKIKVVSGNFQPKDLEVQLIVERETKKLFLRLKFKYGVLPKGSKLRFGSSAVFLFK
jgi:hypothetical protein